MSSDDLPRQRRRKRTPHLLVKKLLANPHRARMLEILKANPGMNKHQLSKALGVRINALEFHVKRMAEAGFIELRPSVNGREQLCFRREDADLWNEPATRVLFGRGPRREVATYLVENPGVDVVSIADAVDLSHHQVRRHLRVLEDHDLVQRIRVERQVYYQAEPALAEWLETAGGERSSGGAVADQDQP